MIVCVFDTINNRSDVFRRFYLRCSYFFVLDFFIKTSKISVSFLQFNNFWSCLVFFFVFFYSWGSNEDAHAHEQPSPDDGLHP